MPGKALIRVGVVVAAHGIRGEVKIRSFSEPPEAIFSYKPLSDSAGKRSFALAKKGGNEKAFIAAIEGISDRNAAELLKGTEIFTPASAIPKKKNNEWYAHELVGLEAKLSDGKTYGKVTGRYNFGAGDIIEIELANSKTEMLPFAPPFVGEVDVENGTIIVSPPDYVEGKE